MIKGASRAITCSRWLLPRFSLGLGIVVFVVSWVGGLILVVGAPDYRAACTWSPAECLD
jgi:hypothetical protein